MKRKGIGIYSRNWAEIADAVKDAAGWKCVRCGSENIPGHVLTVHHLDMNRENNAWWNLAALCQVCHLQIQGKVILEQPYMFEHSEWFKPYVAGYYAHRQGLPETKEYVYSHLEELLKFGAVQP